MGMQNFSKRVGHLRLSFSSVGNVVQMSNVCCKACYKCQHRSTSQVANSFAGIALWGDQWRGLSGAMIQKWSWWYSSAHIGADKLL